MDTSFPNKDSQRIKMKFKIKCNCGQSILIKTKSQRKVINCPACDQRIEALAPVDKDSRPKLTGAILDDELFARAFPFESNPAGPSTNLGSGKNTKGPGGKTKVASDKKTNVFFMLGGFFAALALVGVIVLIALLWPRDDKDDGDDKTAPLVQKSAFPAEISNPVISSDDQYSTLSIDLKITDSKELTNAAKVNWIVKTQSGTRFVKKVKYDFIFTLSRQGTMTFNLEGPIDKFPISTYLEMQKDLDPNDVAVVSNILVIDKDGKVLSR
jgi:hypothetical protein